MILTCEQCGTQYVVPGHAVGPAGRQVRCKNCQHEWFVMPPEADSPPAAQPIPDLDPIPEGVRPLPAGFTAPAIIDAEVAADKAGSGKATGYLAAAVVFFAVTAGLILARADVVRAWPPAAAAYDRIGLPVVNAEEHLVLQDIVAGASPDAKGNRSLMISGEIVNGGFVRTALPPMEFELLAEGKIADRWKAPPPQPDLGPNGRAAFHATYPMLPKSVTNVRTRLLLP